MGEPCTYLVATSRLNGFAHLKHLKLDNFVFGVTFAMISNKLVSIEPFTRRYRSAHFVRIPSASCSFPRLINHLGDSGRKNTNSTTMTHGMPWVAIGTSYSRE